MLRLLFFALIALSGNVFAIQSNPQNHDCNLWLENITDPKSLAWVQQQNAQTLKQLTGTQRFEDFKKVYIDILNKKDFLKIWRDKNDVYYLKSDSQHPRGQLLKVTRAQFKGESSPWELLIDLDVLSKADNTSYVFERIDTLEGSTRALVSLSVQGRDEIVVKEFDLATNTFSKGGFDIPISKTEFSWLDENTLLVSYNEGPDSLTRSGYARRVRLWRRGQAIANAELIVEFPINVIGASAGSIRINGKLEPIVFVSEENGERKIFSLDLTTKNLSL